MKFKADCSFLLEDALAPNCMAAQCLGLLADLGFVAFTLTGYLLSTRMIRNRMCPELRILINFFLD